MTWSRVDENAYGCGRGHDELELGKALVRELLANADARVQVLTRIVTILVAEARQ